VTATILAALVLSSLLVAWLTRGSEPIFRVEEFPSALRRHVALALLTVTIALACVMPLLEYPDVDPQREPLRLSFWMLFLGHALLVAMLFAWWVLAGRPPVARFLAVRSTELAPALRQGAAAGATSWVVAMTLMAIVGTIATVAGAEAPPGDGEVPPVVRAIVDLSLGQRLLLILSAGVVEEAFFRGFLQARVGLLPSSLLFTASHTSYGLPLMLVGVFAVSVVYGIVFRARGDVVPCMVAHGVFDAIQLLVILPVVVGGS